MLMRTKALPIFLFFVILTVFVGFDAAYAVPAAPIISEVSQPDGTKIKVHQKGDEWSHHTETLDGYAIGRHSDKKWYYIDHFELDTPVLSNTPAHDAPPATLQRGIHPEGQPKYKRTPGSKAPSAIPALSAQSPAQAAPYGDYNGNILFILASANGHAGTYTEDEFAVELNNIVDYYNTASYGHAHLTPAVESFGTANNGVVGWVDIGSIAYDMTGNNIDSRNQALTRAAILAADPYVDFSAYDLNHDGYLDATELSVVVVIAGYEAAYGNPPTPAVWAHQWCISSNAPTVDGVIVSSCNVTNGGYAQFGEIHSDHMATMGVMTHELGHLTFGFPDLYDYGYDSEGVGDYCLMSGGSWGLSSSDSYAGQTPVLASAYIKQSVGWINPVSAIGNVSLTAAGDGAANESNSTAIYTTTAPNEYFLIENRGDTGYDRGFEGLFGSFTGGLAIWHVDTNKPNNDTQCSPTGPGYTNCATSHYMVAIEQADALFHLEKNRNRGDNADLYPGSMNKTAFTYASAPTSRLWSGADSKLGIQTIPAASSVMEVAFDNPDAPVTAATATGYTFGNWSSSGSINVTLNASDVKGSGIAAGYPKYCVDSSNACTPTTSYAGAFAVTCGAGGVCRQYVRYFAQDNLGNVETVKSSAVNQDVQAPTTTASASGGYVFGDTSNASSISVTLSSSDGAGSGVAASNPKYCKDTTNTCTPTSIYSTALSFTCAVGSTCTQYIRYKATDSAGNVEAVKSSTVIQAVIAPPTTTASATGYSFGSWSASGTISVTLSAADGGSSGIAAGYPKYCVDAANTCTPVTSYSIPINVTCTATNVCTKYVRYYAKDNLNNIEAVKSSTVKQDMQNPTTTATPSGYSFGSITASPSVSVSLSADDGMGSGIAAGYPKYCVDAADACTPSTNFTGAFNVTCSGSCTQYVRYFARDNVSNTETVTSSTVRQNVASAPVTAASAGGYAFGAWSSSGTVSVTLLASDGGSSGIAAGYPKYCVDALNTCTPTTSYASAVDVTCGAGSVCTQYIRYFAMDNLSNTETVKSSAVKQDMQAPVTTASAGGGYAFGNVSGSGSIAVTLSAVDGAGSGIASGYPKYCVDSANTCTPLATYAGPFNVTCATGASCTQHVRYLAQDNAGNTETLGSSTVIQSVAVSLTGSLSINNGAAFTNSTASHLTLSCSSGNGCAQMKFNNDGAAYSTPEPYAESKAWPLAATNGTRRVYVMYQDGLGIWSGAFNSTIVLDTVAPVNGVANATASDQQVSLIWSGFSDATSGIASYKIAYSTVSTPANCAAAFANSTGNSMTHSALTNETTYYYRICAVDNAGNVSSGATVSAKPILLSPPSGTVSINAGAAYASKTAVTLTLKATDNTGVVAYYKSNTNVAPTPATVWTAVTSTMLLNTTVAHTLTAGSGVKDVYVWYKDRTGLISPMATDSIFLDTVLPTNGIVNTTVGIGVVALGWSGFADAESGLAGYKIAYSTSIMPANCSRAQLSTTDTSYTHTGATMGSKYYYRICAVDNAGNVSSGATATVTVKKDLVGTWIMHELNTDALPNSQGSWSSAQFNVSSNGTVTCSSYKDGMGRTLCSNIDTASPLAMTLDRTLVMPADTGGGALKSTGNMMSWVRDDATSGLDLMLLTKIGVTYALSNTGGTWVGYGLNADPNHARWFGFSQVINTTGLASCTEYGDSDGAVNCSGWGINKYSLGTNGVLTGIVNGAGVMNASKDMMTIVRTAPRGGYELAVLTKYKGAFAQADLTGTWLAYGLKASAVAPLWYYFKQSIDADGSAACQAYKNSEGGADCAGWDGLTYLLAPDGTISNIASGGGVMNAGKDMMTWVIDDADGGYDMVVFQKIQ